MKTKATGKAARDLVEAKERAKRARHYAEKFPAFSSLDAPYCSVEWQLEQLSKFNEKSAPLPVEKES
jgi:hypothetical protein